jgi:hypothetical protein
MNTQKSRGEMVWMKNNQETVTVPAWIRLQGEHHKADGKNRSGC